MLEFHWLKLNFEASFTESSDVCVVWHFVVELQLILDTEKEENRLLREQLQSTEVYKSAFIYFTVVTTIFYAARINCDDKKYVKSFT